MTPDDYRDREEIRQLMARYNIAGDRGDFAGLAATFAPEGTLTTNGETTVGRESIVARLSTRQPNPALDVSRHHLSTSLVSISGDHAEGRTYFAVHTNIGLDHHGVYVDRFVRMDGGWLIEHREARTDWQSCRSLNAPQHVRGKPPSA